MFADLRKNRSPLKTNVSMGIRLELSPKTLYICVITSQISNVEIEDPRRIRINTSIMVCVLMEKIEGEQHEPLFREYPSTMEDLENN